MSGGGGPVSPIPRTRPPCSPITLSSRGPARDLRRQPTTQPLPHPQHLLPFSHVVLERPLTKYVLFWRGPPAPRKRRVGFSARPELRRRVPRAERGGVIPRGRPRCAASPLHHPNSPHQHPAQPLLPPLCLLLKTPLLHPPTHLNSTSHYIGYVSPYRVVSLCTRHKNTYNTCQPSPLNSGTPPRCQPCATTRIPFPLATNSTL